MFCVHCGNKLDDDAVFCTNCGKRVEDEVCNIADNNSDALEEVILSETEFDEELTCDTTVNEISPIKDCTTCNDKTNKAIFCTYCGHKLDDDAVFCTNCGKKVIDDNDSLPAPVIVDSNNTPDKNDVKTNKPSVGRLIRYIIALIFSVIPAF